MTTIAEDKPAGSASVVLKRIFVRLGVLPFLLVLALIVFSIMSRQFLAFDNLTNVVRQSVFLMIVSLGQMMVLLTGGFDLSVGTMIALTSVVTATAMAAATTAMPHAVFIAIALGCIAGVLAGVAVGL